MPVIKLRLKTPDWRIYYPGAILLFIYFFLGCAQSLSTVLKERLLNGLLFGLVLWIPAAPIHLLVQCILNWLLGWLGKLKRGHRLLLINVPILVIMVISFVSDIGKDVGRALFEGAVMAPMPASAKVEDYGYSRSMGSGSTFALSFSISTNDLSKIIEQGQFQKAQYDLGRAENMIRRNTGMHVEPGSWHTRYAYLSNNVEKHILVRNDHSGAYFVYREMR